MTYWHYTSLPRYWDELESWIFARGKFSYSTSQKLNNKGADPTAQMRRLVCAFDVRIKNQSFVV